jgi:crotonobetainyl-CoA:carnitine CoA-transferase CaiB-like acyl-CoA transferase
MNLPLADLKVIDCASYVAGPAAATVLSDFGAQVIKIEPPEGDPYRTLVAGQTYPFDMDGRNKASLVLDLKQAEGMKVLHRLLADADVFLTNLPLPARKRLGIDDGALCAVYPRLIYASMTAYGESGAEADKTGFDATAYWARSGLSDLVKADPQAVPTRSITGMGDHPSAIALYAGIMTALLVRERTGVGQVVRSSLMANGLWANSVFAQAILNDTPPPDRPSRDFAPNPIANIYRCADGRWINITVLNARQFPALCETLGRPDLINDVRFATHEARLVNNVALVRIIDEVLATAPLSVWRERLDAAGITFSLISRLTDIPQDQQLKDAGVVLPYVDGQGWTINSPFDLSACVKRAPDHAARQPGRDSRQVLKAAGYSDAEIDAFESAGVTRQA